MKTFNRIFLVALLAGGIAGLFVAGIQHFTVVPMVLEAETYETASENGHHGDATWAPEEGAERTFYTVVNSVIAGIGFGLLLTACYALRRTITWRSGILWGLAGFAVFHLAPAVGLPPELPGAVAAGLETRQLWWLITVMATAMGLAIIAFQPDRYLKLFGVVLIAVPHLFGSPKPEVHGGLVPAELSTAFIYTSLITNAIFWIVLGMLCAYFFNKIGEHAENTAVNAALG